MITINHRQYTLSDLPPEVFPHLKRMQDSQAEIARLEAQLEAFQQIQIEAYLSVLEILGDRIDHDF